MSLADSAIDREALAYARALLKPPLPRDRIWLLLAASALAAVSALALAAAIPWAASQVHNPPAARVPLQSTPLSQ
jgi:hypothetical protein